MSARDFYSDLGVTLPGSATSGNVSVSCFANRGAHKHDDHNPSCSVSLDTGQHKCFGCGAAGGAFDAAVALGRSRRDAADLAKRYGLMAGAEEQSDAPRTAGRKQAPPKLPAEQQIAAWREALLANKRYVDRLRELRGWSRDAIDALGLGLDGKRVTFAIRGADGSLVGLLRYAPNPEAREGKKMLAARGSTRDFFPAPETLPDGDIWLVEGEPDAVAAHTLGLPATALPGAETAKRLDPERFRRFRRVLVLLDCDEPGRKAAGEIGSQLAAAGIHVRVLDFDSSREDGYDLGDLAREAADYGSDGLASARQVLERMAAAATPVVPREVDHDPASELSGGRRAILTPASAIRTERVHWLWEGRIPRRALVVVAGEKGLGKSTLTNAYLVARLTRGELEGEFHGKPIDIALATAEDDWRSVVVPRLIAHGADLDRAHRLDLTDPDGRSLLTLPDDVSAVEQAISELRARSARTIGMLVIDPITAFLSSSTDSHKDASVRRALFPLADMAERLDLAVVVVAHLKKDDSGRLLSRVTGSGAFTNAARAVLAFARDPSDPDEEQGSQRVLVMAATNWGRMAASLAAHIDSEYVLTDEGPTEQPLLVVDGESHVIASDLQRGAPSATDDEVADEVLVALRDGPREAREVKDVVAGGLGVSWRTVERAAAQLEEGGMLIRDKSGFPAVATWRLAPVATISDATRVATEQAPISIGDSMPVAASGDNGRCPVGTSAADSDGRAVADLTDDELRSIFPGSTIERDEP